MTRRKPQIMGILNVTPDSFYDRSRCFETDKAIEHGIRMFQEGADLIDIGGESTRPGAPPVSEEEEMARVIPVIKALKKQIPIPISIDTQKPRIAETAIQEGASILNDVSGFHDPKMIEVAAKRSVKICVMHMKGSPRTMQEDPHYEEGILNHLLLWMEERAKTLIEAGVQEKNIIFDPGIGFGKTVEHNLEILHNLQKFKAMGFPILLGLSRKSFMGKIVNKPSQDLLPTTIAMNTVALMANVDIIRIHDVAEHRHVVDVLERYFDVNKVQQV
ncbi:MAG: Dihydropteroate synthase [Chlamydiae bacterium]|nr:Dihydropteroate synthase [Chlamydiota bacterium]